MNRTRAEAGKSAGQGAHSALRMLAGLAARLRFAP